jgi:hypothetical protein
MYKKIVVYSLFIVTVFSSCIKSKDVVYTQNIAELDAASFNTVFGTLTYPFVTRQPLAGRAILSADPFITRVSGTATFRVNLLGKPRGTASIVKYNVVPVGSVVGATVSYVAPVSGTLTTFDGVSGTHYTDPGGGVCTIPANSSFGTITLGIIDGGVSANTTALLSIELVSGGDVEPSSNYKKIALAISQK